MPSLPTLMPTRASGETFGGVTYHIDGELVPVLTVDVSMRPVFFEHHILLWKHPTVSISLKPMKGALKRMMAGMQVFVTQASGQGMIAFSRDGAGHIVGVLGVIGPTRLNYARVIPMVDYAARIVSQMLGG